MPAPNAVIELLSARVSCPALTAPAPTPEQLAGVLRSALRAPDHRQLRPWRYLVIEAEARVRLGELFRRATLADEPQAAVSTLERVEQMPLRAPMIIVGISRNLVDDKVPVLEQQISCGVGMGYMLLALQAIGFGGIWRTGALAAHPVVREGLGIVEQETLIGFLYLGTPASQPRTAPEFELAQYFSRWPAG
jgi:nitroreductase